MPARTITLNKMTALKVGNMLALLSGSKGHRHHQSALLRRLMKVWTELDPESVLTSEIPEGEVRQVDFMPEEQTAVAYGLVDLASSEFWPVPAQDGRSRKITVGEVKDVRDVAALCGSGILKFFDTHLSAEKVEPFDGEWEEDKKILQEGN